MRKFKHIKTGLIATPLESVEKIYKYGEEDSMHYLISEDMLEVCDGWEEIVEKNYEILSFIDPLTNMLYTPCNYKGNYCSETTYGTIITSDLYFCLKHYEIHSIKRLSDGEIFTIGDKVQEVVSSIVGIISSIKTFDETLFFSFFEGGLGDTLDNFIKLREMLFTTYDGVKLYEGDTYYCVRRNDDGTVSSRIAELTEVPCPFTSDVPVFAKKENAEEYVLFRKPCLSLNDLLSVWSDKDETELYKKAPLFLRFKDLAKTKLVMEKELTPLEYFINYFTPKLNDYQIEEFKKLIEAGEQGKYLFLIKKRGKL